MIMIDNKIKMVGLLLLPLKSNCMSILLLAIELDKISPEALRIMSD